MVIGVGQGAKYTIKRHKHVLALEHVDTFGSSVTLSITTTIF